MISYTYKQVIKMTKATSTEFERECICEDAYNEVLAELKVEQLELDLNLPKDFTPPKS